MADKKSVYKTDSLLLLFLILCVTCEPFDVSKRFLSEMTILSFCIDGLDACKLACYSRYRRNLAASSRVGRGG
jgi:hypothetical protein